MFGSSLMDITVLYSPRGRRMSKQRLLFQPVLRPSSNQPHENTLPVALPPILPEWDPSPKDPLRPQQPASLGKYRVSDNHGCALFDLGTNPGLEVRAKTEPNNVCQKGISPNYRGRQKRSTFSAAFRYDRVCHWSWQPLNPGSRWRLDPVAMTSAAYSYN